MPIVYGNIILCIGLGVVNLELTHWLKKQHRKFSDAKDDKIPIEVVLEMYRIY